MFLSEFNQADPKQIQALLQHCVHIRRWADNIIKNRPFNTVDHLLKFAKDQANSWSWDEIDSALNTHPRIGEKQAKAVLSAQENIFSNREQAALSPTEATLDALYEGNLAYEKKFGFIFLIKATGLNSEQILTALNTRLLNDIELEKKGVHQHLLDIALLRLAQEIQA
ncbi:2-oxo-4-hydroxy-4-carboxy-5-ureidoimidazoline decarboxylase [Acinetobacter sp. KS-LM10]|uniref:2-oxo-4-hydroxy-4-carboxy-5-ureidoimidazoline decarboxylase n=1 Tax=Acinetobacter sp. KS-LM10 TaxID=3120518 RepID=UPI0030CDEF3E